MRDILTRLQRAWCGLTHQWTQHRGFHRCPLCQPEHRRRRVVQEPTVDPAQLMLSKAGDPGGGDNAPQTEA